MKRYQEPENDPRVRRAVLWARFALATAVSWPIAGVYATYASDLHRSGMFSPYWAAAIGALILAHVVATEYVFRRHLKRLGFTGGLDRALWPTNNDQEFYDERPPLQLPEGEHPSLDEKGRARLERVLHKV